MSIIICGVTPVIDADDMTCPGFKPPPLPLLALALVPEHIPAEHLSIPIEATVAVLPQETATGSSAGMSHETHPSASTPLLPGLLRTPVGPRHTALCAAQVCKLQLWVRLLCTVPCVMLCHQL